MYPKPTPEAHSQNELFRNISEIMLKAAKKGFPRGPVLGPEAAKQRTDNEVKKQGEKRSQKGTQNDSPRESKKY